jgi:hypothetical protein
MNEEPVFIAANVREAEFVETLFEREGIEYDIRPEPYLKASTGDACLMGVLFEVSAEHADACRELLARSGLERGVIPSAE